jgi:hypothetical protein
MVTKITHIGRYVSYFDHNSSEKSEFLKISKRNCFRELARIMAVTSCKKKA